MKKAFFLLLFVFSASNTIAQVILDPNCSKCLGGVAVSQDTPSANVGTVQNRNEESVVEGIRNYPNPFNPTTTIQFSLKNAGVVEARILNISGQVVTTLVSGTLNKGTHEFRWDANQAQSPLPSGLYFLYIRIGNQQMVHHLLLVK